MNRVVGSCLLGAFLLGAVTALVIASNPPPTFEERVDRATVVDMGTAICQGTEPDMYVLFLDTDGDTEPDAVAYGKVVNLQVQPPRVIVFFAGEGIEGALTEGKHLTEAELRARWPTPCDIVGDRA